MRKTKVCMCVSNTPCAQGHETLSNETCIFVRKEELLVVFFRKRKMQNDRFGFWLQKKHTKMIADQNDRFGFWLQKKYKMIGHFSVK